MVRDDDRRRPCGHAGWRFTQAEHWSPVPQLFGPQTRNLVMFLLGCWTFEPPAGAQYVVLPPPSKETST